MRPICLQQYKPEGQKYRGAVGDRLAVGGGSAASGEEKRQKSSGPHLETTSTSSERPTSSGIMSRSPVALGCTVLLMLVLAATGPTSASISQTFKSDQRDSQQREQEQQQQQQQHEPKRGQQQGHQEEQQQLDIDLTELTPNLEHQLQQARRLNQRDSADEMPLALEAYRYSLVGPQAPDILGGGGGGADERPLVQPGEDWFERVQTGNSQKRRSGGASSLGWLPGSSSSLRYSRGLPRYYHTKEDEAKYSAMPLLLGDQKEDKAYAQVELASNGNIINNGESAARDSLWTSGLLRDLLIAQEAANRVRRLNQLARATLAERRLKAASKMSGGGANSRINGIDFLETREKKRRCKVDPNLGVKNPSFCDTDAYFGAADYSMRDVWDSAGRR